MKSIHFNLSCGLACVFPLFLMLASSSPAADILLTGADELPSGGDPFVGEFLLDLGHNVDYQVGANVLGADVVAGGYDLYIMSSTSLTSGIRDNGFDQIPTPILTWESSMVRDVPGEFFMTDDQQSGDMGTSITIRDASHPLMMGLDVNDGDEIEIFFEPQNFFGLTGDIAPGATLIATGTEGESLEDRIMMVELPAGAEVLNAATSPFDDGLSPGQRIHIPLSDTSFPFLNDTGLQIFTNAVNYALGNLTPTPTGDFNGDGQWDISDIDLLMGEIGLGSDASSFDLNGDELVNDADRDQWLAIAGTTNGLAGPYLVGDANLDTRVNATDLNALAIHWLTARNAWSAGNFTGAGVNVADLNALALNWQDSVAAAAAVPEPSSVVILLVLILGLVVRGR